MTREEWQLTKFYPKGDKAGIVGQKRVRRSSQEDPLGEYYQALLEGLKYADLKPTNLSKVADMKQSSDELPPAFLEDRHTVYILLTIFQGLVSETND